MRAWALALVLGGCGFSSTAAPDHGLDGGSDTAGGNTGGTGDPVAGVVHVCLGTFVGVCADTPRTSLTLMTGMIDTSDTSSSTKCLPATAYVTTPAGLDVCVVAAQTITIPGGNKVSVTGRKRLVLLANDTLTISGTLDVASHRNGLRGPAADTGPCPTNFTDPTTVGQGGGGWGGTFGQPGNNGGSTPGGGIGGIPGAALTINTLGGGCPGGNGAGSNGGPGGPGGGAVVMLAGQTITISGVVNASGAGGSGGGRSSASAGAGGGGGGTGGMIALEAPSVKLPGQCFANGGAGGEGSSVLGGN
ncbi:MAG TPA: hypothetical protein VF469_31045, partial [Kofleriaceae bacterium]